MKIRSKIKDFFKVPNEVFEEEPSPEFGRQKVCTLTRTNIFIGLFLFTLIVNLLVGLDLNFIYLRQILGFLFLVSVPGILIMLCFKIREIGFWGYLVYTVGLSISFIMFAGLAVNWILPWLNITDKPLSLYPILICFDILLIILGIVTFKRNKDLESKIVTVPKLDLLNNIFFIIPMTFPVLSILGAFLLNNHGTNILTMIMLGGIAVYVLLLTIFRKKFDKNIYPWALWMIGFSLLISFSMRGWYIVGWDSFREVQIFNLVSENFKWDILLNGSNYNACLSLTLLPTIINLFVPFKGYLIFKLIFQLIFGALIPVIIFLTVKKYYNSIIAFLSSLFFLSAAGFIELAQLFRQEVAFLFFSLIILIISETKLSKRSNRFLFFIFISLLIVSHYSTTYIFSALILCSYLFFAIIYRKEKSLYLSFFVLVIILSLGFLWNLQITNTSSSLIVTLEDSFKNLKTDAEQMLKDNDASIGYHLNPFYTNTNSGQQFYDYAKDLSKRSNLSSIQITPTAFEELASSNIMNINLQSLIEKIIKVILKLFVIIGVILLFFDQRGKKGFSNIKIFSLVFLFLLLLLISLPSLSLGYDVGRLFQQMLIILSPCAVVGGIFTFSKLKLKTSLIILSVIMSLFLLFSNGFIYQIIGGGDASLQLNNLGGYYWDGYASGFEFSSVYWLKESLNENSKIYADRISNKKLRLVSIGAYSDDILISTNSKKAYLFLGNTNTLTNIYSKNYLGYFLYFTFPKEYIEESKGKIYDNGGSEIFK